MGGKIKLGTQQLSLAAQIGPGTRNKMKLICCFVLCSVKGLEHPTVSGFRIQCVLHMTMQNSSTAAAVVRQGRAEG